MVVQESALVVSASVLRVLLHNSFLTGILEQYALTEASYVVIRLLQTFKDIENRDPVQSFVEHATLTLSSGTGTIVVLTPA